MAEKLPRIVIIGAGASGISAASRLINNGLNNVRILEAENRIGGRIYSIKYGDSFVDLGAQSVADGSIVHDLSKNSDLLCQRTIPPRVYHSRSGPLSDSFAKTLLLKIYELYIQEKSPSISWKQHLVEKYQKCVVEQFETDADKAQAEDSFHFVENVILVNSALFSLEEGGQRRAEYPLNFKLGWKTNGFQSFFDVLVKKDNNDIINEKISLNSEVTKIEWYNGDTIKVICTNGDIHFADYVIITIPLGPLKKHYKTLFSPQLPERKEKTIELLKFGGALKILFHFPNKWWTDHDLLLAWGKADLETIDFKKGPNKNGQSWITNLLGLFTYSDNPNILSALFTGSLLPEIELTSEDILFDGIYYVTQKFFGKHFENITRPDGVKLFNWYSNPHFGGMTPAETIESKKEGLTGEILAQPLLSSDGKLQLLFAGEAANGFTYGSVNGAVIAGFREADRIIDICKNQK